VPEPTTDSPATAPQAPPVAALDPPMVPFAVAGTVAWALAGLALLLISGPLGRHVDDRWLWMCLAGVLFGFLGLAVMLRHDRNRARRRAAR
jgi:hypothetical protein